MKSYTQIYEYSAEIDVKKNKFSFFKIFYITTQLVRFRLCNRALWGYSLNLQRFRGAHFAHFCVQNIVRPFNRFVQKCKCAPSVQKVCAYNLLIFNLLYIYRTNAHFFYT